MNMKHLMVGTLVVVLGEIKDSWIEDEVGTENVTVSNEFD